MTRPGGRGFFGPDQRLVAGSPRAGYWGGGGAGPWTPEKFSKIFIKKPMKNYNFRANFQNFNENFAIFTKIFKKFLEFFAKLCEKFRSMHL